VDATVVGVREYSPARLECAVPLGGWGYDGRTRYCVATAFKLGFKLGDPARPHVTRKKCSDSPMTQRAPLTACQWRVQT
jgi:hypothetical protein